MERYFILDKFNTYYDWNLIVTSKDITPPEPKTNYVDIDGMNGTLDLSESLTGEVTYKDRTISATFWTDVGNRKDRAKLLRDITLALHGKKVKIIEPDDDTHYFYGRIIISAINNNLAYLEFKIEAICEPWRYSIEETKREITFRYEPIDLVINNNGAMTVCPAIKCDGVNVSVTHNGITEKLLVGEYKYSNIKLVRGVNVLRLTGTSTGTVTLTYREADL